MALVDCPECTKPISSEAYVCPNCGYPTAKQRMAAAYSWKKTLVIWVVLIVAFLVIWQLMSPR